MGAELQIGRFFDRVELESCRDAGMSRPRVRPVQGFPAEIRVEFPRDLREMFPIGTRFLATVRVCQKHQAGKTKGPPYLKAYDIAVIADSVPDAGLVARVRAGSISGLSYAYEWKTRA